MTPADVIEGRARWTTLVGDVRETLRTLPDASVQCVVTSPPYWGLRDYGCEGQIGQEPTPAEYVATLRDLFRELRRVLRENGTAWLNLGDSYASDTKGSGGTGKSTPAGTANDGNGQLFRARRVQHSLKPKDLVGIPWRVAFALQDDGWWLRSDIVWAKPNPMPESVTDRPTRAHEFVFLLTKSERYLYDADAIKEPASGRSSGARAADKSGAGAGFEIRSGFARAGNVEWHTRNARDVWTIASEPYDGAHFATMPPELARRCVRAGSRRGDVVLDPFGGSGTTARVALEEGRRAILCELNPEYVELQRERLAPVDTDAAEPIKVQRADFGPLFGGGA